MSVTIRPRGCGDEAPWCNVANENARPLLATVGIDAGEYLTGEIAADEIAGVLADVEAALGHDADALVRRAPMLRAPDPDGWRAASEDDHARARLAVLHCVLLYAQGRGLGVVWS